MLRKFAVENYKKFENRVELDLTASRNYGFNKSYIKNGIMNKALIVGKNGCGKTSLGLALFDIVYTLTDRSFTPSQRDAASFINGNGDQDYATFEYEFEYQGRKLTYMYRKTSPDNIVYESLHLDRDIIFIRDGIGHTTDYSGISGYNAGYLNMDVGNGHLPILRYIANNTIQNDESPITFIVDFASHMLYFRSLQENAYAGILQGSESIEDYIIKNDLVEDLERFIRKTTDQDIAIEVVNVAGMPKTLVQSTKKRKLPFREISSSGTQALMIFFYWMNHFGDVSFLFMDEFDAFYHHELAESVLEIVSENPDVQAVLTSHNTSLINNAILRPDCYLYMDNSGLRSFSDRTERDIREGHNLERLYRGGEFDE